MYYTLDRILRNYFAGMYTTVVSAMKCGRKAIAKEEDPVCFQLAVRHVEKLACIFRDRTEAGTRAIITVTVCENSYTR